LGIDSLGKKAQTSVEVLVILGIALLVMLAFLMLTQSQSVQVNQQKESQDAANAVSELASAAKDVYAQGVGAKKQVKITLPSGYEPNESSIGNNAIRLRANGNDYVEIVDFSLHGSLPKSSGNHFVWVISEGSRVRIGDSMIVLDSPSLNVLMPESSEKMEGIVVRSSWDSEVNVTITPLFNNSKVDMGLGSHAFALMPLSSGGVAVVFTSGNNASGFHSGYIELNATDGKQHELVVLPVTVEVSGANVSAPPELSMLPGVFNKNASLGENLTVVFQVCAGPWTRLSSVSFDSSINDAGDWVNGTQALGAMEPETCQPKSFTISIPLNATAGTHRGRISARGSGSLVAEDYADIVIDIPATYDVNGPDASDIRIYPEKPYAGEPLTFSVVADDSLMGNSTIKGCEIKLDSGTWQKMEAADGTFDESSEKAVDIEFSGLALGKHFAQARCTDAAGNTGSSDSLTFHVMKDFLFVASAKTQTSSEDDWISWLSSHKSGEGYAWAYDVTDAGKVSSNSLDLSYYSAILLAQWDWKTDLEPPISAYMGKGGNVVLLGNANLQGTRELKLTDHPATPSNGMQVKIVTNSTYISEPFLTGIYSITDGNTQIYSVWDDFSGVVIATGGNETGHAVLGSKGKIVFWGATEPDGFNEIGGNITMRVLDNAVMDSTITPG